MGKILPVILALAGLGGGVGAGLMLKPEAPAEDAEAVAETCVPVETPEAVEAAARPPSASKAPQDTEFVKLNQQFVVPVLDDDRLTEMVVLSLSVEVAKGHREDVFQREPKLRDALLKVLFDHSNAGGFDGNYIGGTGLNRLRDALRETAVSTAGQHIVDILIVDLVKQDV